MIRLRKIADRCTLVKVIIFCALLAVAMLCINGGWIGVGKLMKITEGVNIPDFDFGYSAEVLYERFAAMGNEGREYYQTRIIPMDFLFPASYALFYISAMGWSINKLVPKSSKVYLFMIAPVFAMVCDWAENLCMIWMLVHYPTQIAALVTVSSIFTKFKFLLIYFSWAAIAALLLIIIGKYIKRRL